MRVYVGSGELGVKEPAALDAALDTIVREVERRRREAPFVVALDGRSGSGKSTLAGRLEERLDAARISGDDFYAAHVLDAEWNRMSASGRVQAGIDWRRQRGEVLVPLRAGRPARYRAFDYSRGPRADGTYPPCRDYTCVEPRAVIVLDGAYSTRPELADLVDLAVLVDTPIEICHARLDGREDAVFLSAWHARWDPAERYYFREVRPRSAFDLVVTNAPGA